MEFVEASNEMLNLAVLRAAGLPSHTKQNFAATVALNLTFIKKFYIIYIENKIIIKGERPMTNDIYSRLLAGESVDSIAAEFAAALNEAQKQADEEKARLAEAEKQAQAAAAAEARAAAKHDELLTLMKGAMYFLARYYPSFGITEQEVDEMSDETLYTMAEMILMLLDLEALKPTKKPARGLRRHAGIVEEQATEPVSADDVFNAAFKMLGL